MQYKLPLINSAHGSETRNIINELIKLFNTLGYTYNEALQKAHDVLSEAQKTNDMNKDVQKQLDDLILNAGVSDAEVVQARGNYPLLKDRLNAYASSFNDNLYFGTENQLDFVNVVNQTNAHTGKLYVRKREDRTFEVAMPFQGNKVQQWYMEKDANDDFIKLSGGFVSNKRITSIPYANENYDSRTGTWTTGTVNEYATSVGATMTKVFTGDGIIFKHHCDQRGGVWRFEINNDPALTVEYSTYGTVNATKTVTLIDSLEFKEHIIVATFLGDDPENTPSTGAGTSRGWAKNGDTTDTTYQILKRVNVFDKETEVFKMVSNKEFAIAITPTGATATQWIPEHNGVGTAFAIKQEVLFDGVIQNNWDFQDDYYEFNSVQVVQELYAKHPEFSFNMAKITQIHTFNSSGVFIKSIIEPLENFHINNGYFMMAPVDYGFADKMITSLGGTYPIEELGVDIDLSENDKSLSYLFVGSGNLKNYVGAMTIDEPKKTLRVGGVGRRSPLTWLQVRSTAIAKLYPQVFHGYNARVGDVYEVSGRFTIGSIPLAKEMYG